MRQWRHPGRFDGRCCHSRLGAREYWKLDHATVGQLQLWTGELSVSGEPDIDSSPSARNSPTDFEVSDQITLPGKIGRRIAKESQLLSLINFWNRWKPVDCVKWRFLASRVFSGWRQAVRNTQSLWAQRQSLEAIVNERSGFSRCTAFNFDFFPIRSINEVIPVHRDQR